MVKSFRIYYIFENVKRAFECYGYAPIETPTMENIQTLTGKYGDEGDRLIFKVLNSGDYLSKAQIDENTDSKSLTNLVSVIYLIPYKFSSTIPIKLFIDFERLLCRFKKILLFFIFFKLSPWNFKILRIQLRKLNKKI